MIEHNAVFGQITSYYVLSVCIVSKYKQIIMTYDMLFTKSTNNRLKGFGCYLCCADSG